MRIAVLVDQYPALSETFVINEIAWLHRLGHDVHVETMAWADPRADEPEPVPAHCVDDDGNARRARDLAWLAATHPRGTGADVRGRQAWAREETVRPLRVLAPVAQRIAARDTEHLHAHFAAGAALDALRLGRILGLPYSVTAHAYDIYREPRNLALKLREAAFAGAECEYSAATLREHASNVHVTVMGVDHEHFRRTTPYPGGRTVLAVGRLVEKKGFAHLIDAVARIDAKLIVVGDGPLRDELHHRARGIQVQWRGAQRAAGVKAALEEADVLAVTAVPVPDGDRDVLPLIVGEALAMEVPVVASDFVGLPEVVKPPWGRLTPPGDVEAIAAALEDVLHRPRDERIEMGRAGREFVVRTRDLKASAEHVASLMATQITTVR